jgi:branched-chain amino acid transport system ATP-binding protein
MIEYTLEARGLRKSFGALAVTDDVHLKLKKGARHALIGPNGAGKTTLVGLLSGVIRPNAGQILLAGQDITRAQPAVRTRLGLVRTFQLTNLFAEMTVTENLYLAVGQRHSIGFDMLRAAGRRENVLDEVQALLDRIGMGDYAQRKVSELAYGHQRLVEIAMALALEPRVLLLDEPAAGIPTAELAVLIDVIEQLDPAITVLIIEHDMELVRRVAHEATVLVAGRVLLEGAIGAVMASDEVHRVYLGRAASTRRAAERIDAVG